MTPDPEEKPWMILDVNRKIRSCLFHKEIYIHKTDTLAYLNRCAENDMVSEEARNHLGRIIINLAIGEEFNV